MNTICKVRHRLYVPSFTIAIKFCDTEFIGENADKYKLQLREEIKKLEKEESAFHAHMISLYKKEIEELKKNKLNLLNDYNNEKSKRSFVSKLLHIKSKEQKTLLEKIDEVEMNLFKSEKKAKEYKKDNYYSYNGSVVIDKNRLHTRIQEFLNKNEFRIATSTTNNENSIVTEMWEKSHYEKNKSMKGDFL